MKPPKQPKKAEMEQVQLEQQKTVVLQQLVEEDHQALEDEVTASW